MRAEARWFRRRDGRGSRPRRSAGPQTKLGPDAPPGGGGERARAHVLDSESGGANGHYPNPSTTEGPLGSKRHEIFWPGTRPLRGRLVRQRTAALSLLSV